MTYQVVTREQWGARPPESTVPLRWGGVDKFIVHYSGAARTQSVRSIQNYCMDQKNHSDIDYNDIVRATNRYIGRGVNVGSHTLGLNSSSYGVCIIGNDGDATDDDFRTVRIIYDELTAKLGRQLRKLGHRTAMPPGYTTCPGDEIQAWIDAGMPYPATRKVFDMFFGIVSGQPEMYSSDGLRSRLLPAGAYESTVVPLEAAGVPRVTYPNLDALFVGMGPLVKDGGSGMGVSEDELRVIMREEIAKTRLS
jgi:N-acetylmuramoyl-L-alanine amidase.